MTLALGMKIVGVIFAIAGITVVVHGHPLSERGEVEDAVTGWLSLLREPLFFCGGFVARADPHRHLSRALKDVHLQKVGLRSPRTCPLFVAGPRRGTSWERSDE